MKKNFLAIALSIISTLCVAQVKPEKFLGIAVNEEDSVYYANQAEAWHNEIKQNPRNETAWKYYYMASHYEAMYQEIYDSGMMDSLMEDMSKHIPGTYTYYYCKYRESRGESIAKEYAEKALQMLPADKDFFDYDNWVAYLFFQNRTSELKQLAKEYYNSGIYSDYVLESSRNELAGMERNAIYVGTTDMDIIPKLLLIYGNEEHTDKSIIKGGSDLLDSDFQDLTFKHLGLNEKFEIEVDEEFASQFENDEELDEYMGAYKYDSYDTIHFIYKFIMDHTGRPLYFSRMNLMGYEPWIGNLMGEGFALKYHKLSEGVTKSNVLEKLKYNCENVYKMDFLKRRVVDERCNCCYSFASIWNDVLSWLCVKYKKDGNEKKFKETNELMRSIYEGMDYDDFQIKELMELLDEFMEDNTEEVIEE